MIPVASIETFGASVELVLGVELQSSLLSEPGTTMYTRYVYMIGMP